MSEPCPRCHEPADATDDFDEMYWCPSCELCWFTWTVEQEQARKAEL